MSFFKNLFGKGQPGAAQQEEAQVAAVALVYDVFIMFDGNEILDNWVAGVLHAKWPGVKLPPRAQIKVSGGFKGSDDEAKAELERMLEQAMAATKLKPSKYEKEFFSVHSESPIPMKIWCMAAIKSMQRREGVDDTTRFIATLGHHLQRTRAAFPQLGPFLDQYFGNEVIADIAPTVVEKMKLTRSDGQQHSTILTLGVVAYHISTLPVDMAQARDWFVRTSGGYTKLLERAQNTVLSQGTDCSVWCHIIYGWAAKDSWVHMAICPIKNLAPINATIMPIELLTPEERRLLGL